MKFKKFKRVIIGFTVFFLFSLNIPFSWAVEAPKPLLPVPTEDQLAWQRLEYIAFAHFGMNTFTNKEWGDGTEDPAWFNPTEFDAGQWVRTLKDAGMKLLILTAKHHDGFCLWPSEYTEHSVKNSPWRNGKGDVVKDVAEACHQAGIKFGIYLSPWDRHEPTYGNSPIYNGFFRNQLRELLSNYGEITEVWFDGAFGEGPNGRRQVYDFPSYYEVVRELQPHAVIAIVGPDVRWVGNESGVARETEWSVQVIAPETNAQRHTGFNPANFNPTKTTGSLRYLTGGEGEKGEIVWYPAECDVSIRPGWFYHKSQDDKVKSLDHLLDIYYKSIGRNSVLLLNLPPDQRGLIHENDRMRLQQLRKVIDATFKENLTEGASVYSDQVRGDDNDYSPANVLNNDPESYWATDDGVEKASIEIHLKEPVLFDVIKLREPVKLGQRIAQFNVEAETENGWEIIAEGTTIGYKRLIRITPVTASKIRVNILKSRACPLIQNVALYKQPIPDDALLRVNTGR